MHKWLIYHTCILSETACIFVLININFLTYFLVLTKSFAIILTASWSLKTTGNVTSIILGRGGLCRGEILGKGVCIPPPPLPYLNAHLIHFLIAYFYNKPTMVNCKILSNSELYTIKKLKQNKNRVYKIKDLYKTYLCIILNTICPCFAIFFISAIIFFS